ncbi:MAG: hypothetical protein IJC77_01450 [Bacteroidaceae bacterium]|nr:hypothetical protein [Bacteroidaceae bacterium]
MIKKKNSADFAISKIAIITINEEKGSSESSIVCTPVLLTPSLLNKTI